MTQLVVMVVLLLAGCTTENNINVHCPDEAPVAVIEKGVDGSYRISCEAAEDD